MDRGPSLVCTQGTLVGQRFPITTEGLRIGREPGNEVVIEDTGVSRQHARVLLHNGAVWVQDAGSRNGIFINGERVPDHKQLKVGDRLSVGSHLFEVAAAEAVPQLVRPAHTLPPVPEPVVRTPVEKPAPKWKIWPFILVIVLVVSFIACIGIFGAVRDDGSAAAKSPTQPAYSLTTLLDAPPAGGATPAAPLTAPAAPPPTVQQALAGAGGTGTPALPAAPAGATARDLQDMAQGMYDSGRLVDARTHYQMALQLDPACELCKLRIERISSEIATKVQQQFDVGMRAFDSMQYAEAQGAWETVLMLVPDPQDAMHVRAAEYLQKAKDAAGGSPR